jgi:Flp pilus assembly pilin Flp
MFIYLNKRKGQSTLEYAIIIAVVVAALVGMQVYMKRGLQGKIKEATDQIGEQFSPDHTYINSTIISNTYTTENVLLEAGRPITKSFSEQNQIRDITENVESLSQE